MRYVGVGRRSVAVIVDTILFFAAAYIMALFVGDVDGISFEITGAPACVWFLLILAYLIVMEATVGATVGKLLVGLRVVKSDESPINWTAALIRNVLRIVDALFVYLVGAISIWTSPKKQRLGDKVANTVVVRTPVIRTKDQARSEIASRY